MCGICGILHADGAHGVEQDVVHRMTDAISHRGPDDDGYFFGRGIGLGMRRLSIIDLEGGKQPIGNEDGTVRVVYNGEIYNYRELRRDLERAGHVFATSSDTEVVVHAYEQYGGEFLGRLRGMFALAVWDECRETLVLAVDRFGIKPLYYASGSSGITFGSELKCLMRAGTVSRELDLDALGQYFTFSYIPPPGTIFSAVRKLAPGEMLERSRDGRTKLTQYWESPRDRFDHTRTLADTRSQLRGALEASVRSHLVSDVPVGAFLSGGMDSSAIVALMSKSSSEPVRTFSIGFADRRYSELDKAKLVAQRYGTQHQELVLEPASVDLVPKLAAHFDEPFGDSSALPTYHVSKLAREHVKVVLSGDGGDELFLGYTLFRGLKLAARAQALPEGLRRAVAALPQLLPRTGSAAVNDRLGVLLKRAADTMLEPELAFKRKVSAPGLEAVNPVLSPALARELGGRSPFEVLDRWLSHYRSTNGGHPLERFVYTGFQTSLAGDMLVKVDRMSMANSIEVRVPFLDHVLAEYVSTIPVDRRMPGWRLKGLLRDALADDLPAEIRKAPKRGFVVPLAGWFRGDLDEFARDILVSPEVERRGFLDTKGVEKLLRGHREGAQNLGTLIWVLLMFELWCREALD